jgi:hypothetical protein
MNHIVAIAPKSMHEARGDVGQCFQLCRLDRGRVTQSDTTVAVRRVPRAFRTAVDGYIVSALNQRAI